MSWKKEDYLNKSKSNLNNNADGYMSEILLIQLTTITTVAVAASFWRQCHQAIMLWLSSINQHLIIINNLISVWLSE